MRCKELRSHYSCSYNKRKAEQGDKSITLLRYIKELRSQGKPLPHQLEREADTENQFTGAEAGEKKPAAGDILVGTLKL